MPAVSGSLALALVPLVLGREAGRPLWAWAMLAAAVPVFMAFFAGFVFVISLTVQTGFGYSPLYSGLVLILTALLAVVGIVGDCAAGQGLEVPAGRGMKLLRLSDKGAASRECSRCDESSPLNFF
ncbi:hypothetical protein [Kitasatospora sp. NPDC001132]